MDNVNTLLLLEFLSLRRKQFDTYQQLLRNEEISTERSYNLLFSHFSRLNRTQRNVLRPSRSSLNNNFVNEMTDILSSLERNVSRPSLSTQTRNYGNIPRRTTRATNTRRSWRHGSYSSPTPNTTPPISNTTPPILWHTMPRTNTEFNWTSNNEPPTQAEIEISTCICKFSDISTNQITCPIARTNFEDDDDVIKIIHCGHIFKKENLLRWFETRQTCPVCRHNITARSENPIPPLPGSI